MIPVLAWSNLSRSEKEDRGLERSGWRDLTLTLENLKQCKKLMEADNANKKKGLYKQ